jgi:uncharacterized membrane protein
VGLLYLTLSTNRHIGPPWLVLAVEAPVLILLVTIQRVDIPVSPRTVRTIVVLLLAAVTALIATALASLIGDIVAAKHVLVPRTLLGDAAALWLVNVIVFALWYWELDGGGPHKRHSATERSADLLFPQQSGPGIGPPNWHPSFLDYLFVAFTNSTAFSPTDTLPLTPRIKVLMMVQALCSLLMIGVVAARAVNILR